MKNLTFVLLLLLSITYYSCSKDSSNELEKETTIYAMYNDFENPEAVIKLWKNGEVTNITDGTADAYGFNMHVSNSDVYIVGDQDNLTTNTRDQKLWKNGVEMPLSDIKPEITFLVDVNHTNNNLYVLGDDVIDNKHRIKLWKNGTPTYITDGTINSRSQKIYVDNNDVYILGRTQNDGNSRTVLTVWKNGSPTSLTDGTNTVYARDIFVLNGTKYILGREVVDAVVISKLWVNDKEETVFDKNFSAEKLFVHNNDVYVIGTTLPSSGVRVGQLYKNGKLLADFGSGETPSYGVSVFAKDNTVYATFAEGITGTRKYISKLWVDGDVKELSSTSEFGWVQNIFVE